MLKPWWKSPPSLQIDSVADWQMPVIGDKITPWSSPSPSTSLRTGFDLHPSTNRMAENLSEKYKDGCVVIFLCNKLHNLQKDLDKWFHFIYWIDCRYIWAGNTEENNQEKCDIYLMVDTKFRQSFIKFVVPIWCFILDVIFSQDLIWLTGSAFSLYIHGSQIAKFMGPTWGPPGSYRPQMGPTLAPRTLLSGVIIFT